MFTQPTGEAPDLPTQKGKPRYGVFTGSFSRFSLSSVTYPCSRLYPAFLNVFRKRKSLSLFFSDTTYICNISLVRTCLAGYAETILWNKTTGWKCAYRQFLPAPFIRLPTTNTREVTACRASRRYIHVFFRRGKKDIEVKVKIKGDAARPDVIAFLTASMNNSEWNQLSFCRPQQNNHWPVLSWLFASPLNGSLCVHTADKDKHLFQKETSLFFLDMRTGYYAHMMRFAEMTGIDIKNGSKIAFRLSCGLSFSDTYNDNALFVDGKAWALPPVYITFPFGINEKWIIQDTENMVDLTFKPISDCHRVMNLLFTKTNCHTVLGEFEGKIVTGDGEELPIHGFSGIGKKQILRM